MTVELHYTSAPAGLKAGRQGYCAVAATPDLPAALEARLESLGGYRIVYPPGHPCERANPVVVQHVRLPGGEGAGTVLSRIAFAGLDYSGRDNTFAHHVVVAPGERPAGGPAWLARQPGFFATAWDGKVRQLSPRTPPPGDAPFAVCRAWQRMAGDAGWAAALAEAFRRDPERPAVVIVPPEPAADPLELVGESLSLLPPEDRWRVTFSTYFTGLPPSATCAWRFVLAGSREADAARQPGTTVIDLTHRLGAAPAGPLADAARAGVLPRRAEAAAAGGYGVEPPPLPGAPPAPPSAKNRRRGRPSRRTVTIAAVALAVLAVLGVGVVVGFTQAGRVRGWLAGKPAAAAAQPAPAEKD